MDTKLSSRLDLLADNTLTQVFERNRLKDLGLNYEKVDNTIQKNLAQLRQGLKDLEHQLSEEEQFSTSKQHEDQLIQLQVKVDKLDDIYTNGMSGNKEQIARDVLLGNSTRSGGIRLIGSDEPVDPSSMENGQILQLQQRIIQGNKKKPRKKKPRKWAPTHADQ
ncbi:hypothetical protein BC940DRAFT_47628 [Gongronella butleri]|nr:hypothetical protein BC940DRAFT_47628 [Gongronella butleri]